MTAQLAQALELHDIHAPGDPAFWPPAPGWWVLAGIVLVLLSLLILKVVHAWRRQRLRRGILERIQALPGRVTGPELAARVSELLKRVALRRFPRKEVARLNGAAWVAFLDRTGGDGRFANGPGRPLASGPYRKAAEFDADALLSLAIDWVRKNT